jgi:hypothetical protein
MADRAAMYDRRVKADIKRFETLVKIFKKIIASEIKASKSKMEFKTRWDELGEIEKEQNIQMTFKRYATAIMASEQAHSASIDRLNRVILPCL